MKKLKKALLILFILYWLPFLFIYLKYSPQDKLEKLPSSDAVIVFGTLVHNNHVSALLQERLDASIAIYQAKKAKQIVVSNTQNAAITMQQYLIKNGIPSKAIALDTQADKTPDTCRYEKRAHQIKRSLIFISQGYHLPRISFQCAQINITATTFPAENIRNVRVSTFSSFQVFTIRVTRYFREAGLTWLALLELYK